MTPSTDTSAAPALAPLQPPRVREFGAMNWLGLKVLIGKETGRFLKVYAQTIAAPVITTLLFYMVFALALGGNGQRAIGNVSYMTFLAPGLIMMSMAQNAFANTSSSIVISKVQGNIVDVLMPPISALELTIGYAVGGILRGLLVGAVSITTLSIFVHTPILHPGFIIYHAIMGSLLLALMGMIGGIWSNKFDHLAAVQNFIIMPATFLSGTFYTAARLPEAWRFICHLNPFFYMIDGFRYGFIGISDGTLGFGLALLFLANAALFLVAYHLIDTGYKIKS